MKNEKPNSPVSIFLEIRIKRKKSKKNKWNN